jgi:hypothetical protein
MENKKSDLSNLKERYKSLQEKYSLPLFEELNREFSIEKIVETETDFLLREIIRLIGEKISNYMHLVEVILNPINSPLFIFSIIKTLGEEEKKKFNEMYKEFAKIQVQLIELDVNFSEEKEANFIKETYAVWEKIKNSLIEIIERIKSNWDNKSENNSKAYFG